MTVNVCGKCKQEYVNRKETPSTTKLCKSCKKVVVKYIKKKEIEKNEQINIKQRATDRKAAIEKAKRDGNIWSYPVDEYFRYEIRKCLSCSGDYVSNYDEILICEKCDVAGCKCRKCSKHTKNLEYYSICEICSTEKDVREKIQSGKYLEIHDICKIEITYKKEDFEIFEIYGYLSDLSETEILTETFDLATDFLPHDLNEDHSIDVSNYKLRYYYTIESENYSKKDYSERNYGTIWTIMKAKVINLLDPEELAMPIDF